MLRPDKSRERLPRWRRRLRWWLAAGITVLLLILLPPLINANRYQRQIARSMSLSLGRPVYLDNVSLHLLPLPGLTLSNLVVGEDPAFGAEPTIRANTVEASLRLSSLWRRRVEFSTVRFVEPSVNLVRNPEGRWNLADVLLHASHVETAPTGQRKAGPAPRFPYIEATGGRVNFKRGDEKLPFSLTAADFALWQPSPHQWRIRLRGQPDRTDVNVTDPGALRIEGDLFQETSTEPVRIDLHADWYDAPLGEATLLLAGSDMGWRGRLNLDAELKGTLDAAQFRSKVTLGGLRRAEFAPAQPLDLQISCQAKVSIQMVLLSQAACSMPDDGLAPMRLTAAELDLQHPERTQAALDAEDVPNRWVLLWAGLFSPRIAATAQVQGTSDAHFVRTPPDRDSEMASSTAARRPGSAPDGAEHRGGRASGAGWAARDADHPAAEGSQPLAARSAWSGTLRITLPPVEKGQEATGAATAEPSVLLFRSAFEEQATMSNLLAHVVFRLDPTTVHPDPVSTVQVQGQVSGEGYTVAVAGTATIAALLAPARILPQLGDDLEAVLPVTEADAAGPVRVDFRCVAAWGTAQVCSPQTPGSGKGRAANATASRSRPLR